MESLDRAEVRRKHTRRICNRVGEAAIGLAEHLFMCFPSTYAVCFRASYSIRVIRHISIFLSETLLGFYSIIL